MPIQKLRRVLKDVSPESGETWLVALSGGADSVFLLRALHLLAPEFGLALAAGHLDHSLRGDDSRADADFVKALCLDLAIPLIAGTLPEGALDSPGESPEAAARQARYDFLEGARVSAGARRIVLAHHADDQAETLMLRFLVGSGLLGLSGMCELSEDGRLLRPLLSTTRSEIRVELQRRGWSFREDASNLDTTRPRNYLRHELLPRVEAVLNPGYRKTLGAEAEIFRQWAEFAAGAAEKAVAEALADGGAGILALERAALLKYPEVVRKFALGKALRDVLGIASVSRAHLGALDDLLASNTGGRRICLPRSLEAAREGDRLVVYRAESDPPFEAIPLPVPGQIMLHGGLIVRARRVAPSGDVPDPSGDFLWLDPDRIRGSLEVRRRRSGDRFEPLGLGAETKLKDFLIGARVPMRLRRHLWLLGDSHSILWILELRPSERARLDRLPEEVIEVRLERPDRAVS